MALPSSLTDRLAAFLNGASVPWSVLGLTPAAFHDLCAEEGLTGLVHCRLRDRTAGDGWPEDVRDEVAGKALRDAVEEGLRQQRTRSALDALASAGVTPILMKGTPLAYSVYRAPSLRPREDTDLLIRRDQVDEARRVMTALGFAPAANSGGEHLFAQFQYSKEDSYGVEHVFDFHWKISTQPTFAAVLTHDELAADAIPIPSLGPHAYGASPLHALLLACIHPAMHHKNAEHLIWMYDIHLIASRLSDEDFDRLVALAVEKRVGAICAHELARAHARFSFRLPPRVIATLAACEGEPSAAYLRPRRRWADELMSSLRGLPRWRDRLGLLREVVFPSPRYMLAIYRVTVSPPRSALLLPALYAHRLLRGFHKILAGRK